MRAILIAIGDGPGVAPLDERYPVPLLPLVDRPFVQHVIEFLAGQGVTRFEMVLSHLPEKIEQFLGEGERWGVAITFHLARDPVRPYRLLKALKLDDAQEPLLLGHADRLPLLPLREIRAAQSGPVRLLFNWRNPSALTPDPLQWTGWALITADQINSLPRDADEKDLQDHLAQAQPGSREVGLPLSMQTFPAILDAHRAVLKGEFPGLQLAGREVEPGVWLSRNVDVHPTVRLTPPVYIADDCRLGAGVRLGPYAVLGKGCVLDEHCTLTNAIIFPGSYVGKQRDLADVIIDKNRLMNARVGGTSTVVDGFILGVREAPLSGVLAGLLARALALLLLLLAAPALLLTAVSLKLMRRGPVLHRKEVVRLPASTDQAKWQTYRLWSFLPEQPTRAGWRDCWLSFLPALVNIVRGELRFVGVRPRSRDEIKALGHDWQALYLQAKAGLITEASVASESEPTEDDLYAAESYYSVTASRAHDLRLLFGYLTRILFGFQKSARGERV